MRSLLVLMLTTVALSAAAGKDVEDEGIPLVITVMDQKTGLPIPFAAVREQQEKELHPVDRVNGQFSTTMLYPSYNEEIPLEKGMELVLEVTAANYVPRKVSYTMRRRNNKVMILLEPMDVPANIGDEPVWQFARDVPIGGRELSPEELARIEAEAAEARARRAREQQEAAQSAETSGGDSADAP